jgi:pimeloyl-ACP methyl ester carboxylesterase
MKVKVLKTLKKVPGLSKLENFAKNHIGSPDYKNASIMMKKILVNTVNEDLSECAKNIKVPTLLIWGTEDVDAPLEDAKKLEELLVDGGLVTYEGGTHYTYLEFLIPVCNVIKEFIK